MAEHPAEHTVLVLGAGASAAEAQRFRPKQPRDHPPLDQNFFRKVRAHADANLLDRVVEHAAEVGQRDLFRDDPPVSLEEYLGRLYFRMRNDGGPGARSAYFDLVRLYAAELLETTNWLMGRNGSIRRVMSAELAEHRQVTVLTFNHDLLVEGALWGMPSKYRTAWCLEHAYGIGPLPVIVTPDDQFDPDCPGKTDQHVSVFKLHGSLNWVFRTRDAYPPQDFPQARANRQLFLWNNLRLTPNETHIGSVDARSWYLWQLIIPPVYEKHGFIRKELREIWRRAGEALNSATKVVFWGYSFPRADLHARYFFDGAAQDNLALRSPILINPDPQAETDLWMTLRPRDVNHFQDVREYLR